MAAPVEVSLTNTFISVITFLYLTSAITLQDVYVINTVDWENVQVRPGSKVSGLSTWVDQKTPNARACMRMCWLYTACSGVTFTRSQDRCQIYRLDEDGDALRTQSTTGSLVVDMTGARLVSTQRKYGCHTRPCKVTEMCAPVKNAAHYVCISLIKESSQTDIPVVPNSETHFDGLGSVAYTCKHGYFQRGSSYISTFESASRTWSSVDISCTFVDCGSPPPLHGALASGTGTLVNSEVTYNCLAGAVPSINHITVICEGDTGQWSPLQGSCSVVTCGQLPAVDNMNVTLTPRSITDAFPGIDAEDLQMGFGGTAEYTCKPGYVAPDGTSFISQCEADGTWSSTDNFRCSPVDCGPPSLLDNASHLNFTGTTLGENVKVTCLSGFSPVTGLTLTCDSTGTWAGNVTSCDLIDCGNPPTVNKANVHYRSTVLNAEATYNCEDTAVVAVNDNSTSKCQEDGEWSPVDIQCIPIPCGVAPPVDNSSVTYQMTEEREFVATHSCDAGYVFASYSTQQFCDIRSNTWRSNADGVRCVGVSCGPAPHVTNATVEESGRTFPSQAVYSCEAGYTLTSEHSIKTCTEVGSWSNHHVVCDRVGCGSPTFPSHAVASPIGVTLRDTYSHEDTVNYLCQDGHAMVPSSSAEPQTSVTGTLVCSAGNWSVTDPVALCSACNVPLSVSEATWKTLAVSPTRVEYTCDLGYNFTADSVSTLTCLEASREWRGDGEVRCERVDCGEPPAPGNGTVSHTGTRYNDTATYSCDSGYRSSTGDSERKCNSDGTWSGSQLECEEWKCDPPPDKANGNTNYTSLAINSTAQYICNAGLGFVNVSSRANVYSQSIAIICNEEKRWVIRLTQEPTELLKCEPVQCFNPPTLPNGNMVYSNIDLFLENTTIKYECLGGYRHRGLEPVIMCTESGTWSFPFFECVRIDCGSPQPIKNAAVRLENDTTVGSKAHYTCDIGYSLVSSQWTRLCRSDGSWSSAYIECAPYGQKHCGDPPPLPHASVEVYSSQGEWTALYTCVDNYKHSWSNTFDCFSPYYYWMAAPVMECVLADCGKPPVVDHAQAYYTDITIGSTVIYRCAANFDSTNVITKKCTTAGSWPAEPLVECILPGTVTCGDPPHVKHSTRTYTSTIEGSVATYTCVEGFTRLQFEALCENNGLWKFEGSYECSLIKCGNAPAIQNAAPAVVSGEAGGSVAVYTCLDGYKLTGTSLKMCEADGTWSSDLVECVPESYLTCGDPPKRDHTDVTYGSRAEGTRAIYSCHTGYTGHNTHSNCGTSGWSEPHISCERVSCNRPTAIAHAGISLLANNIPAGRSVVHSCKPGYTSSTGAPLSSTCMDDGTWSPPDGTCDLVGEQSNVICPYDFPRLLNGKALSAVPTHVGSTFDYACDAGYFPMPTVHMFAQTCLSGGIWSYNPLTCYRSMCLVASPPSILNAEYNGLQEDWDIATSNGPAVGLYSCLSGFTLNARRPAENGSNTSPTVNCDLVAGWAQVEAALSQGCMPVDCGLLELPERYATVSPTYNTSYLAQVEIACRPPFFQNVMDTHVDKIVTCSATGEWLLHDLDLLCTPCNQTVDFPNGTMEIQVNGTQRYGIEASLQCDPKYHLIGHQTVHCGSVNGSTTWKGLEESRCVQNVWQTFNADVNAHRCDIHMDAVTIGFSACARVTNMDRSEKLRLSLKEKTHTAALLVADLTGTTFQEMDEQGNMTIVSRSSKVVITEGFPALVCLILDVASSSYTFVKNGMPELTMEATRYKDLTSFRLGMYLTIDEVYILYNSFDTQTRALGVIA